MRVAGGGYIKFEKYISTQTNYKIHHHLKQCSKQSFSQFQGGNSILQQYQGSFIKFLHQHYSIFKWTLFDSDKAPPSYWSNPQNILFFLELISQKLPQPVITQSDWQYLDEKVLIEHHGKTLLNRSCSILKLLEGLFPQFFWQKMGWFSGLAGVSSKRMFIDGFVLKAFEDVETLVNLCGITYRAMVRFPGGNTILALNHGSPHWIFGLVYPEFVNELGGESCDGYLEKRVILDRFISRFFGFVELDHHLTEISHELFRRHSGGARIMEFSDGGVQSLFMNMYPEFVLSFKKAVNGYWDNLKSDDLLSKAIKRYHIRNREDWYKLSIDQFSNIYGKKVPKGNFIRLLEYCFPEEKWEYHKFSDKINKRSNQKYLGSVLTKIFKDEVVLEDYFYKYSDKMCTFDFYIPERKLVVEYQGEQHYFNVLKWLPLEDQKKRDQEKIQICKENGLELIYIPYWWDNNQQTLKQFLNVPD